MAERNKLASIPGQPLPERKGNFLSDLWDEASGAFARYGRRSGAQRDASLALLNQAVDPNTDPFTGAGMKALGLAGLVTHPLAFFPTREEWDQRLQAAGNDSRIGRSIGGFLSDLPSLIDPQMAAGGAVLATAPLAAKMAKPGLGKGLGDLIQDAANNKELDALGARLQAEAAQVGGSPSTVSREQALQGLVGGGDVADAAGKVDDVLPYMKDPSIAKARKDWFSGSKILDDNNEPLTVHHWTYGDFDVFDRSKGPKRLKADDTDAIGHWFTDNAEREYANTSKEWGGKRIDANLNIKKPFYIDDEPGFDGEAYSQLDRMVKEAGGAKALRDRLKAQGYDGIVLSGTMLDGAKQNAIVAFEANQIKSVKDTKFDPNDNRFISR